MTSTTTKTRNTKQWIVRVTTVLAAASVTAVLYAAGSQGGDGRPPSGGAGGGNADLDNYPAACNGKTLVNRVSCPPPINYVETLSAPNWSGVANPKAGANFASASVNSSKVLSCTYSSDGNDRMTISQPSAGNKACSVSTKFAGFNCCK